MVCVEESNECGDLEYGYGLWCVLKEAMSVEILSMGGWYELWCVLLVNAVQEYCLIHT